MRQRTTTAFLAVLVAGLGFVPRAGASPADCASPCVVTATFAGYVPPVVPIAGGTEVAWHTADPSHPTADFGADKCFRVPVGAGVTPVPVRFDVVGGGVEATTAPGTPLQTTSPCTEVVALVDGSYAVPFHCLIHPHMVGTLRVDA